MNTQYERKAEAFRLHILGKMNWLITHSEAWKKRRKLTEEAVNKIPVSMHQEFLIKGGCPMCESGDLLVQFDGWEMNDVGDWEGMDLTRAECSNEPDIMSDEWDEFQSWHGDMPYVNWLPRIVSLQNALNRMFRFVEDMEATEQPRVLYVRGARLKATDSRVPVETPSSSPSKGEGDYVKERGEGRYEIGGIDHE
jgi:hypothetical protein